MAPATARETETVSLVNISTEKWPPRHRTYFGSLEVRSPESGETYAITPIRGCTGVMDLGDKRIMEYRITAREIAEDVAREINGDSGEGSFHGVFVAAGPEPTEAELADARQRLEEFQRRLVAAADLEWERTKNPMFITDLERRSPARPREAVALRSQAAGGLPRLRRKDQAGRRRLPFLRRHPRPREGRPVRPRPARKAATRRNRKTRCGREAGTRISERAFGGGQAVKMKRAAISRRPNIQ